MNMWTNAPTQQVGAEGVCAPCSVKQGNCTDMWLKRLKAFCLYIFIEVSTTLSPGNLHT